jgi:hypothetical protein
MKAFLGVRLVIRSRRVGEPGGFMQRQAAVVGGAHDR